MSRRCWVCKKRSPDDFVNPNLFCCKSNIIHTECYKTLPNRYRFCVECFGHYPDEEYDYDPHTGLAHVVKYYSTNGMRKVYTVNRARERHGVYGVYRHDGALMQECHYNNGQLEGQATHWIYPTGPHGPRMMTMLENYKDDELNGVCTHWNNNGTLKGTVEYEDGLKHGYVRHYEYPDGITEDPRISYECQYRFGARQGPETSWYPKTGRICTLVIWRNLCKTVEKRWSPSGELLLEKVHECENCRL